MAFMKDDRHTYVSKILGTSYSYGVKWYFVLVRIYVSGERNYLRPHEVYIFLIGINSWVDIAMSVGPDEL